MNVDIRKESYLLSDNKDLIDIDAVCEMLGKSYWACDRNKNTIIKSIENSKCYGLYFNGKQIGFLRVVTDEATFAWICDVIIHEDYRTNGLGKWMVECVVNDESIKELLQVLFTKNACELYNKYGFKKNECMAKRKN